MVTKKGRFGTDPYDIFLNHGMSAPRKLSVLCKDAVPYGSPFGHGYKKGSVPNRPLRYFSQPRDVGDAILYKIFDMLRKDADVFSPRPLGEGQGEGKFGAGRRPRRMLFRAWS